MEFIEKTMKLKKQVEYILKHYPETRDSDIALTIQLWRDYYPGYISIDGKIRLSDLYTLPREDNIKRVRAKFQNTDGLYPPTTWEIAEKRGFEEIRWRRLLGYNECY